MHDSIIVEEMLDSMIVWKVCSLYFRVDLCKVT